MNNQPKSSKKSKPELRRSRYDNSLHLLMPENVEDEARILKTEFFKTLKLKSILYWTLSILSIGILPILCVCKTSIRMLLKYVVAFPEHAESLLIHGYDGTTEQIHIFNQILYLDGEEKSYKCFTYRFYNYYFDQTTHLYKPCQFSLQGKTYKHIHKEIGRGMDSIEVYKQRYITYGINSTNLPPISNLKFIAQAILSPLNISQLYAIIIWSLSRFYIIYAAVILILSVATITINFLRAKANYEAFRKKTSYETEIRVYRPSIEEDGILRQVPRVVNSTKLVPGDIVEIPYGTRIPCDIILLRGACRVNESILTGESMFVIKQALPQTNEKFNIWTADQHLLFAGTECLEAIRAESDPQLLGLVIRTGFWTMKARLIRSYRYSKKNNHQFLKDIFRYFGFIALIPFFCFLGNIKFLVVNGDDNKDIAFKFFNIINVAIPPMLPTLILVITFVSSLWLERKKIISKSAIKISLAGKIDTICFDKTGILTNDSFDLHGVRPASRTNRENANFDSVMTSEFHENLSMPLAPQSHHLLLQLMASCNNITYVNEEFSGDPLDIKTFQSIGWSMRATKKQKVLWMLKPPNTRNDYSQKVSIDVLQRFEFNTKFQRIGVICRSSLEEKHRLFVKGSPETIRKLCLPASIPRDFNEVLSQYEQCGYQILACATQVLMDKVKTSDNLLREYFEQDLEFLGFLIYENKLKEETSGMIEKLNKANISSIILTGDKPSTSFFIADLSGIIKNKMRVIQGSLKQVIPGTNIANLEWSWLSGCKDHKRQIEDEIIPLKDIVLEMEEVATLQAMKDSQRSIDLERHQILEAIENDKDVVIVLTGEAFKLLAVISAANFALYSNILKKTKVYSQMNPDNKTMVIKELQRQGYVVAMCGNGLNDGPSLRAADIGVAIGEGEASFASSFISKVPSISCLDTLLREGRSNLITIFLCFKYMSMYSLIQTFSQIILYSHATQMSGACYIFQDILVALPSAIAIAFARPINQLSEQLPPRSLMSFRMLFCIIGHALIQSCFQVLSVHILHQQPWYLSPSDISFGRITNFHARMKMVTYDNTTIFLVSNMQVLTMVIAFSVGKPFRQPIYKNFPLMFTLVVSGAMNIILILSSISPIIDLLRIIDFRSHEFRWILFGIVTANSLITIIYEKYIVDTITKFLLKIGFIKKYH